MSSALRLLPIIWVFLLFALLNWAESGSSLNVSWILLLGIIIIGILAGTLNWEKDKTPLKTPGANLGYDLSFHQIEKIRKNPNSDIKKTKKTFQIQGKFGPLAKIY